MNTREKPRSPLRNIVNTDVSRIEILEHQLSELKDLICRRFQSDNKHVVKYNSVISEQTAAIPTVAERLSKNDKRKSVKKIKCRGDSSLRWPRVTIKSENSNIDFQK